MKRKQRRKLIWMVAGLAVLLYLGLAVYFHNHFFPKTTLNGRKAVHHLLILRRLLPTTQITKCRIGLFLLVIAFR